jgi:hypothetical protein
VRQLAQSCSKHGWFIENTNTPPFASTFDISDALPSLNLRLAGDVDQCASWFDSYGPPRHARVASTKVVCDRPGDGRVEV